MPATTHGLTKYPFYQVWLNMRDRCYNPKSKAFKNYGGRGIEVCNLWRNNADTFIGWALNNGWKPGLNLDRQDNNKGYSPENCRFVNATVSKHNQRLLGSNNTSGYRGVHWIKSERRWRAVICSAGKQKYLGQFTSRKLAAIRYDVEAFLLEDGRPMNFIEN